MRVSKTKEFDKWLRKLKDPKAKAAILYRILRIQEKDLIGDFKRIDSSLLEIRIHLKGGYRVYFTMRGETIVLLLVGGIKSTQARDIKRAKRLLKTYGRDFDKL